MLGDKGAMFISGFNTLSKDEKELYDKTATCSSDEKLVIVMEHHIRHRGRVILYRVFICWGHLIHHLDLLILQRFTLGC